MDPAEVDPAWEEAAPRSVVQRRRAIVGMMIAVAVVAWSVASPPVSIDPGEPQELGVETDSPQPEVFDHVSFLGNSLLVDDLLPELSATYVSVQWGGGSMAAPDEPDGARDLAVFYLCDGEPVRVTSEDADLPIVVLIAGAGVHTQLMGCQPTVPDVRLDSMGLALWSLPMLVRLNTTGLVADLSTGQDGVLEIAVRGSGVERLAFSLRPAFSLSSRPPIGSNTVELAGGEALLSQDTHYLNCDRGSTIVVEEQTAALANHLDRIECVPAAPVRPRDPMDDLARATQSLADSMMAGGVPMFDLESHRPVVRFTVAGPAGEVRMLSLSAVTIERAGDVVVRLASGAVLQRRDGGIVAECQGVLVAIDPEYEPIAVPTLQAMASAAGCVLRTPAGDLSVATLVPCADLVAGLSIAQRERALRGLEATAETIPCQPSEI